MVDAATALARDGSLPTKQRLDLLPFPVSMAIAA